MQSRVECRAEAETKADAEAEVTAEAEAETNRQSIREKRVATPWEARSYIGARKCAW